MNRSSYAYKKARAAFLAKHEDQGWWQCWCGCGRYTQSPEIDHIDRTGMGGSPRLLMDESNWQILHHDCHQKKDSGMRFV